MKQHTFFFTIALLFCGVAAMAQDSTRKEILGRYKFPAGSVVEEVAVGEENGGFTMTSSAGVSPLTLIKGDTFNIVNFNGTAVFTRNNSKKITGVHIDASGYVLDGVKDSASMHVTMINKPGIPPLFMDSMHAADNYYLAKDYIADKNIRRRIFIDRLTE